MSKVTAELVKGVISTQPVDTLAAEDLQTGEKLYYATGAASVLCEAVDSCEQMMVTPYRLRVWSSQVDRKRGNKPADQKPFVWTLPGRHGWSGGVPVPPSAPAPVNAAPSLDRGDLKEWATAVAERNAMQAQLDELRKQLEALTAEDEDAEDEDAEDEPVNGAPQSWWHTEAAGEMVKELAGGLSQFLKAKAAPKVVNAAAPLPPAPGITEDEAAIIRALRTARQTDPENAEQYAALFLSLYGPKKEADEQAQH